MTNTLVGDVYAKIIEEVKLASTNDFEESGVGQNTLNELQQEWQHKMSQRNVAQMPWDPKPAPPVQQPPNNQPSLPSAAGNGMPSVPYQGYENGGQAPNANGHGRVKAEPGTEAQFHGLPASNNYPMGAGQGGAARASQLIEAQYGQGTAAQLQQRGGLALPGQHQKPQNLPMPAQNQHQLQQQYAQQQHQNQLTQQRQAQHLQQQQQNPRIKVENNNPNGSQAQYQQQQQRPLQPGYGQTDGTDEALKEWQAMMARRRAVTAEQMEAANHMMRDRITALSDDLQSGLMMPLDEQRSSQARKRQAASRPSQDLSLTAAAALCVSAGPSVPQLDGVDDDESKDTLKDEEDDEDAINSDLDDPDDDVNQGGDDDDDESGNSILCTYDKVQRVKNKWKCTLKDGILNTNGKDWVFHKGNGEFEW